MKHVFYLSQLAEDSLGLEKILHFYNIIALEASDSVEDIINDGVNIEVSNDFSSPEFKNFVSNYSYNEKPFILSNAPSATMKLSQTFDWDLYGKKESGEITTHRNGEIIRFSVYKNENHTIFGNIHKLITKEYKGYIIEILDWSENFIKEVEAFIPNLENLNNGYTTIEVSINGKELSIVNTLAQSLPDGINIYTQLQLLNKEVPFVLHEIYEDITKEDPLSFVEGFKIQNPVSQTKPYNITLLNIKTHSESVIKSDMPSGIWKYGGDNTGKLNNLLRYEIDEDGDKTLCLLKRGYSLYDLENVEGMIICTREKGISLSTGDLLASLKIPTKILNDRGDLHGWVYETIGAILQYQMHQ